jgi:glycosyltransferase involved in cell wall biosynthesis
MYRSRALALEPSPVCFLLQDLAGGGAERVMLVLASELQRAGRQVELLLVRAAGAYLGEVPAALEPVLLGPRRTRDALPALVRHLHRRRPAWLVAALSHVNLLAIAARRLAYSGTRVLITEHNRVRGNPQLPGGRPVRYLMPCLYRFADRIVAVSEGVADDLALAARLPRRRIEVVYNPIVGSRIKALAAAGSPHPWLGPGGVPVVIGVGRLERQKDFATLLRAFVLLRAKRPARLIILGDGPEREALLQLAHGLGIEAEIMLPGFVANPYQWLTHASLFVLSSAWEGLPTALVEALACGVPVVATDCPHGPREILKGGEVGPLVPCGDHVALAGAMMAVLMAPPPHRVLVERAAEFSVTRAVDRYGSLLSRG